MITISNIIRYDNLPFDQYLQLPGFSHSFLKREQFGMEPEFKVTRKVEMGKLVDGILTDPASVNMRHPLYRAAKKIAARIQEDFGFMINSFQKQVSFTADMEHQGLILPSKFRLDWLIPDYAVIDLKITEEKDVKGLIEYMGYDNQLWGYGMAARALKRFLITYSIPLDQTQLIMLKDTAPSNEFWEEKILRFGRVAA